MAAVAAAEPGELQPGELQPAAAAAAVAAAEELRRSRFSQPGELEPAAAAAAAAVEAAEEFRDDNEQGGDRVSSSVG